MTPTNWVEKLLLQQYAANPAVRLHEPHLAIGFCWQTHGHLLGGRLGLGWLWQGYWFVTLQAQLSVLSVPRLHRRPLNRWGCDSFFQLILYQNIKQHRWLVAFLQPTKIPEDQTKIWCRIVMTFYLVRYLFICIHFRQVSWGFGMPCHFSMTG